MLVRDKVDSGSVVETRGEYQLELIDTLQNKLEELDVLNMKSDKAAIYAILSDIQELTNCLGTYYLTTKRQVATIARHEAYSKVNKERAEQLGGYFNGQLGGGKLDS